MSQRQDEARSGFRKELQAEMEEFMMADLLSEEDLDSAEYHTRAKTQRKQELRGDAEADPLDWVPTEDELAPLLRQGKRGPGSASAEGGPARKRGKKGTGKSSLLAALTISGLAATAKLCCKGWRNAFAVWLATEAPFPRKRFPSLLLLLLSMLLLPIPSSCSSSSSSRIMMRSRMSSLMDPCVRSSACWMAWSLGTYGTTAYCFSDSRPNLIRSLALTVVAQGKHCE